MEEQLKKKEEIKKKMLVRKWQEAEIDMPDKADKALT